MPFYVFEGRMYTFELKVTRYRITFVQNPFCIRHQNKEKKIKVLSVREIEKGMRSHQHWHKFRTQ